MVYFMSNANEYKIKKQLFCIYDVYKYIYIFIFTKQLKLCYFIILNLDGILTSALSFILEACF